MKNEVTEQSFSSLRALAKQSESRKDIANYECKMLKQLCMQAHDSRKLKYNESVEDNEITTSCKGTPRNDGKNNGRKKFAFTLAEVLITLGIIGVVAAMTLPILIQNYQKIVLKNQFRRAYSEIWNGIKMTTHLNGDSPMACYYWDDATAYQKKVKCSAVCASYNVYGNCSVWSCADGSPIPSNYNGNMDDCTLFDNTLFGKALNVVKFCPDKAVERGCLPADYHGTDKVQLDRGVAANTVNPNYGFTTTNITTKFPVWVLNDGVIVIKWYYVGGMPIYTIDVNGWKKPNKWGYDIFVFSLAGNESEVTQLVGTSWDEHGEKGGTYSSTMFREAFNN